MYLVLYIYKWLPRSQPLEWRGWRASKPWTLGFWTGRLSAEGNRKQGSSREEGKSALVLLCRGQDGGLDWDSTKLVLETWSWLVVLWLLLWCPKFSVVLGLLTRLFDLGFSCVYGRQIQPVSITDSVGNIVRKIYRFVGGVRWMASSNLFWRTPLFGTFPELPWSEDGQCRLQLLDDVLLS